MPPQTKYHLKLKFQWFIEAGSPEGRPKKAKTMTTPENIVDLVSTPPPPSSTPVVEEQAPAQKSVIPLDLYKRAIPESVKEKFDKNTELKYFFQMLPKLFQSAQKIHTRAPLYVGSSNHPTVYAHMTSTFTRQTDQEGDVIGETQSTMEHIDPPTT